MISVWFSLILSVGFAKTEVYVGSKIFTESYLLAEYISQTLEMTNKAKVHRRFGMGGTGILFEALKKNEIHIYPEYTGTIAEAIVKNSNLKTISEINNALAPMGLVISESLGFNNTYALAVRFDFAQKHQLKTISDLRNLSSVFKAAFSHEFMTRADGFPALKAFYKLDTGSNVKSMDHTLTYAALENGEADIIDVYSTDAKIHTMNLVVLEDDRQFFPKYEAVLLARQSFVEENPILWAALRELEGALDEKTMRDLNAQVDLEKKSFASVINSFLGKDDSLGESHLIASRVIRRTKEHLVLVLVSLAFSVSVGVPLGIVAAKNRWVGQGILLISSIFQTIPSLALLCFLIPFFGVGIKPALVALFLYGLLPVVLNTFTGLTSIDARMRETARAIGLTGREILVSVELPLASQSIMTGVKTSAIIGIGTATLAALIGAGGYGAPIVTGLAINDMNTILIGAIPAAGLALIAHGVFDVLTRLIVPRGLR